jgi:hypothetical protein
VFADNRPILTLYHQAIFASGTHTLKITPASAKESGRSFTTRLQRVLGSHRWPIFMTERIMEAVGHEAALQAVRERGAR